MNKSQYNKIVKEIAETQAVGPGLVDDIISQYFDLAYELAQRLTTKSRPATLDA